MASLSTKEAEPTSEQLSQIAAFERRVVGLRDEFEALSKELERIEASGLAVGPVFDDESFDSAVRYARLLRITGGRAAFHDWWEQRMSLLRSLDEIGEDVTDNPNQLARIRAVDAEMSRRAPEIIELVDRLIDSESDWTYRWRVAPRILKMTHEQLLDRAESALVSVIASGWRP